MIYLMMIGMTYIDDIPNRDHNDLNQIGENDHIDNIIDIPNRDYKDLNSRGHGNEDHVVEFMINDDIIINNDFVDGEKTVSTEVALKINTSPPY